jgi:HSP20 family protein
MNMTATATAKTALQPAPMKAIEPRDAFELFNEIYKEIACRAFAIFESEGGNVSHEVENWLRAEAELLHPVRMRMAQTDDTITIEAEVPGFGSKDLAIGLEGRRLTICGKRETSEEQKKGKEVYDEYWSNKIMRVVDLPADVDGSKAVAKLKDGVLKLEVPKTAEANAPRIEVKIT